MDIAGKVVITLTKSWLLIQATTSGLQVHFLEISGVHQINYGICALSYALDTDLLLRRLSAYGEAHSTGKLIHLLLITFLCR